jgi:hypothetical protein
VWSPLPHPPGDHLEVPGLSSPARPPRTDRQARSPGEPLRGLAYVAASDEQRALIGPQKRRDGYARRSSYRLRWGLSTATTWPLCATMSRPSRAGGLPNRFLASRCGTPPGGGTAAEAPVLALRLEHLLHAVDVHELLIELPQHDQAERRATMCRFESRTTRSQRASRPGRP